MPHVSKHKAKRGGNSSSNYSMVNEYSRLYSVAIATGTSGVFNLDPVTFGNVPATEATIHALYFLEHLKVTLLPSADTISSGTNYTRGVAFVPGTNETNPTTSSVLQLSGYNRFLLQSSGETLKTQFTVSGKYLHLASIPRKYVCEASVDTSVSDEVQGQLLLAHTSASSSTFVIRIDARYRFLMPANANNLPGPHVPSLIKNFVSKENAKVVKEFEALRQTVAALSEGGDVDLADRVVKALQCASSAKV